MEFIKKNFVTILVVGATIVLAGVAMFTAMRLYSLRQNPATPVVPDSNPSASDDPISVRPASGIWNLPETFIMTNTSEEEVELVWSIDCEDENLCEDETGTEILAPGETFEEGLGNICSLWTLELNWTGNATAQGDVWDRAYPSELGPDCDVELEEVVEETTEDVAVDEEDSVTLEEPETIDSDIATTTCSAFAFTIGDEPGIGGAGETASPIVTSTPEITSTPSVTVTPSVTSTPVPTQAELPEAGVGTPVIIGVMFGAVLLLFSMALAL